MTLYLTVRARERLLVDSGEEGWCLRLEGRDEEEAVGGFGVADMLARVEDEDDAGVALVEGVGT